MKSRECLRLMILDCNDRSRRRLFFRRADFTDKSDDRVGHLNTILARGAGILTSQFSKVQMPGEGGGMLKFRVDWCIKFLAVRLKFWQCT